VARRAYADWSYFDDDRRLLARAQVELIEIPQRVGGSRKNAADIKMAVDAIELAYERPFITTFAIGTGDSDFTPLVHKLREMDKRVIGIGVQSSTSALLPPACDEFQYYDRLPGVDPVVAGRRGRRSPLEPPPPVEPPPFVEPPLEAQSDADVGPLVARTLAGLQRRTDGPVLASRLKRAILRKDPTFDEADHGFAASPSCCGTWLGSGSSSWPTAARRATRRSPSRRPAPLWTRRSACSSTSSPTSAHLS
jgi:hypothetical protein